jgi:hypothetical protein
MGKDNIKMYLTEIGYELASLHFYYMDNGVKTNFRFQNYIVKITTTDVSSAKNNRPQAGFVNQAVKKKKTAYKEVHETEFLPSVLQMKLHNSTRGFMGYS